MISDIVLIGPPLAGKSTLGKLLAEKLNLPQCSLDALRWQYYQEAGYDTKVAQEYADKGGLPGLVKYWKPFEAQTVERALAEHLNCVIDFGAGNSVYDEPELFERVQKALADYPNVILILASSDKEECINIHHDRQEVSFQTDVTLLMATPDPNQFTKVYYPTVEQFNRVRYSIVEWFVTNPSNYILAKHVVYTLNKTPEETCQEILSLVTL
jgi:shikimate kinase